MATPILDFVTLKLQYSRYYEDFMIQLIDYALDEKHVTNYNLISKKYNKMIENELTKECENICSDISFTFRDLTELDDIEKIMILINIKFYDTIFNETNSYCNIKNVYNLYFFNLLNKLAKVSDKEEYKIFFFVFKNITGIRFENNKFKI